MIGNSVRFNAAGYGTDDFVVASACVGHLTPEQADVIDGKTYTYYAQNGSQWESGSGDYDVATHTQARVTIIASSNDDPSSKVYFDAAPIVDVFGSPLTTLEPMLPPCNYINGLELSPGGTATFGIAAGQAADSGNTKLMTLGSAITKTNGPWVVGSGHGALDAGTIANSTWYHAHLIYGSTVDVLISLSATSPVLPAGYLLSRWIGSLLTNSSGQFIKYYQIGDDVMWDVPVNDVASDTTLSTSPKSYTITVPSGIKVKARIKLFANSSSTAQILAFSPLQTTSQTLYANWVLNSSSAGEPANGSAMSIITDTAKSIMLMSSGASGNTIWLTTDGWTYYR